MRRVSVPENRRYAKIPTMRLSFRLPNKQQQSGQAVVEYILMLLVAMGLMAVISRGMKKTLGIFWKGLSSEIAAPCPGCPPREDTP
jgi:hypothetical protein